MLSKMVLLSVVGLAVSQGPTPVWFLQSGLDGDFSERSAECEAISAGKAAESSNGPILIPEDAEAHICINFPPLEEKGLAGGWRHDRGQKGACANSCCEFKPPTKNQPAVEHPEWFEASDCDSVPASVNNAPLLFQGQNDEEKNVCIKDGDSYRLDSGRLGNCGAGCCLFYAQEE